MADASTEESADELNLTFIGPLPRFKIAKLRAQRGLASAGNWLGSCQPGE